MAKTTPDHEYFQTLAEHPELIEDVTELRAFGEHLKTCDSCVRRLEESRAFQITRLQPLRGGWRHL